MEVLISCGLIVLIIAFFKSNIWYKIRQQIRYDKERESAEQFGKSLLSNPIVTSLADEFFKDTIVYIKCSIKAASKNSLSESKTLLICGTFINCPSGKILNFLSYGLQEIEDGLKIYGLALALKELFDIRAKSISIPGLCSLWLEAVHDDLFGRTAISTSLKLHWAIEQNKYIEL